MSSVLPEYSGPVTKLFTKAMRVLVGVHEPLLAQIASESVDHLPEEPSPVGQGRNSGSSEMKARFEVETKRILSTDPEAFVESISDAAAEMAGHMMRGILTRVDESARLVGNVVTTKGGPFTYDHFLDLLEKTDFEVNEDGTPDGLTLVGTPALGEQLARLPPKTPEQEARHQQILAEKKRKQDAKKRVRRLDRLANGT